MKKRFKAILGRVAALASALLFVFSYLAFPTSADVSPEPFGYHDAFEVAGIIGDSIEGQYLANDGSMKKCTFSLNSELHFDGSRNSTYSRSNPSSFFNVSRFDFVEYNCYLPSDADSRRVVQFDLGLYVINSSVISFLCGVAHTTNFINSSVNNYSTVNYVTLSSSRLNSSYQYLKAGSVNTSRPNAYWLWVDGLTDGPNDVSFVGGSMDLSGSFATYNPFGEVSFSHTVDRYVRFFVSGVYTSPDGGLRKKGSNITNVVGDMTGSASGTITDSSGNSQDIDLDNISIGVDIDVPDYSSRLDAIEDAINPSLDSSQSDIYNKFDSEGEEYHNLENSLLDNMASQIENMDSIAFEFDPTYVEEAEDFTPLFNYPLVMWMTNLVLIISLISFLIFGKWV